MANPIEEFKQRNDTMLNDLMHHFDSRDDEHTPYPSIDHLLADLLTDNLDVWWDSHIKDGE